MVYQGIDVGNDYENELIRIANRIFYPADESDIQENVQKVISQYNRKNTLTMMYSAFGSILGLLTGGLVYSSLPELNEIWQSLIVVATAGLTFGPLVVGYKKSQRLEDKIEELKMQNNL